MKRHAIRCVVIAAIAAGFVSISTAAQGDGKRSQRLPPTAAVKHKASAAASARVKPPTPYSRMTLQQRARYQERALQTYMSRWHFWLRHRSGGSAKTMRCRGALAPAWACWSLEASNWTRLELAKTRERIEVVRRNKIIARLNRGLVGTPMEGLGAAYEEAGRLNDVSPYLLAAASGTESSFGVSACGSYNAWGLGNCSGSSWVPSFASWSEAIHWYAVYLRRTWPSARTTYDFTHPNYAACPPCWGRKTAWWMASRFGAPGTVAYR